MTEGSLSSSRVAISFDKNKKDDDGGSSASKVAFLSDGNVDVSNDGSADGLVIRCAENLVS